MKRDYYIYIFLLLISTSCTNSSSKLDYQGYQTGQQMDFLWIILQEDRESKFKYSQHQLDSNLTCTSIADTIWGIAKHNIKQQEAMDLKNRINTLLKTEVDSTFIAKVAGIWDCINYSWLDSISGDKIILSKSKTDHHQEYSLWTLTFSNDSILQSLDSRHDPYYRIPPPKVKN